MVSGNPNTAAAPAGLTGPQAQKRADSGRSRSRRPSRERVSGSNPDLQTADSRRCGGLQSDREPRAKAALQPAARQPATAFRRRLRQALADPGALIGRQNGRDFLLNCNLVDQALGLGLDELLLQRRDLLRVGCLGEHLGFELAAERRVSRRSRPRLAFSSWIALIEAFCSSVRSTPRSTATPPRPNPPGPPGPRPRGPSGLPPCWAFDIENAARPSTPVITTLNVSRFMLRLLRAGF